MEPHPDHMDESDLAQVAMFPLPNAVLLPGALLPLHIFEPRYRDMTRDVLDGSGLLAMARLEPGYEVNYHGRPPVNPTLGVGRVIASDRLEDGRYNILVRGLLRAHLAEELPPDRTYRVVRATPLADIEPGAPALLDAARQKLISICDQLAALIDQGGAELRALVRSSATPGECADVVSAALITDVDERQHLLETRDPLQRLERVIRHVGRVVMELNPTPAPGTMN